MLLNEFQKDHRDLQELAGSITQLQNESAEIQRVNAELSLVRPAPQVVTNDR